MSDEIWDPIVGGVKVLAGIGALMVVAWLFFTFGPFRDRGPHVPYHKPPAHRVVETPTYVCWMEPSGTPEGYEIIAYDTSRDDVPHDEIWMDTSGTIHQDGSRTGFRVDCPK